MKKLRKLWKVEVSHNFMQHSNRGGGGRIRRTKLIRLEVHQLGGGYGNMEGGSTIFFFMLLSTHPHSSYPSFPLSLDLSVSLSPSSCFTFIWALLSLLLFYQGQYMNVHYYVFFPLRNYQGTTEYVRVNAITAKLGQDLDFFNGVYTLNDVFKRGMRLSSKYQGCSLAGIPTYFAPATVAPVFMSSMT